MKNLESHEGEEKVDSNLKNTKNDARQQEAIDILATLEEQLGNENDDNARQTELPVGGAPSENFKKEAKDTYNNTTPSVSFSETEESGILGGQSDIPVEDPPSEEFIKEAKKRFDESDDLGSAFTVMTGSLTVPKPIYDPTTETTHYGGQNELPVVNTSSNKNLEGEYEESIANALENKINQSPLSSALEEVLSSVVANTTVNDEPIVKIEVNKTGAQYKNIDLSGKPLRIPDDLAPADVLNLNITTESGSNYSVILGNMQNFMSENGTNTQQVHDVVHTALASLNTSE